MVADRASRPARFTGSAVRAAELIDLARERGVASDPALRQELARYWTVTTVQRLTAGRARTAPSAGAVGKLGLADVCRLSREVSLRILGAHGMLAGDDAPHGGAIQVVGLSSPGVSIGAGTDEIQRTSIGERTLGLPREPPA